MDASPPSPKDSTPTPSSSSTSAPDDLIVPDDLVARLPLSTEIFAFEVRRRKAEDARERRDVIRARCQSLHAFVEEAWAILEPRAKFSDNWHIELICNHLEAVTRGEITRLLVNVWPGSMKSLIVSVFWPAWEWGPCGLRSMRYLSTSFNDGPVKRDTRKTRDLILSDWYRTLWPEVELKRTAEMSFANTSTGTREGVAFGSLTSQRGDRLIIDDPHSTETAESDAERAATTRKFREGAINRLNDQERSAIVVIMQRLHTDDLSGEIMKHPIWGYVHVVLPMEFEPEKAYRSKWGSDPRTEPDELADPHRFPEIAVLKLKESGDYFWAGQYQQRPAPREGGMFKIPEDWQTSRVVDHVPPGGITAAGWDFAGSKRKKSPYTVRAKFTKVMGAIYVRHIDRRRTLPHELDQMIPEVVREDGRNCVQSLPQDPGQAGKAQKWRIAEQLEGYDFRVTPETGDKETRAEPFAAQWNVGRVMLVRGPWNADFIDELRNFPSGSYKDQVDASSRAHAEITRLSNRDDDGIGAPIIPIAVNE